MWPAINKRSLLGFRYYFDEYPDLTDTTCISMCKGSIFLGISKINLQEKEKIITFAAKDSKSLKNIYIWNFLIL